MKITKHNRRAAKELFRAAHVNGSLDESRTRLLVDELLAKKPRGYLGTLSHLHRLVSIETARRSARIESVIALDESAQQNVKDVLSKRYGAGLSFAFAQNPALIGGMRIKVGSDVYDGSIQSRLAQLQEP